MKLFEKQTKNRCNNRCSWGVSISCHCTNRKQCFSNKFKDLAIGAIGAIAHSAVEKSRCTNQTTKNPLKTTLYKIGAIGAIGALYYVERGGKKMPPSQNVGKGGEHERA